MRVDDSEARIVNCAALGGASQAAFCLHPKELIASILAAKTVRFQFALFPQGAGVARFNVDGLRTELGKTPCAETFGFGGKAEDKE